MGNSIILNKIVPAKTHRFGITRQISSSDPAWTRINDAVGMTATPSIGSTAGHSDFDNYYPWKGMVRETLSTGDVMVKIPRFYYRRVQENDWETIEIADNWIEGFNVHPAFKHNNSDQQFIYAAAYLTSGSQNSQMSLSNKVPLVNLTRAQCRSGAAAKGTGWSILDITTLSAIQLLYLVEYANNNSQEQVAYGYSSTETFSSINTGSCDNIIGLTGSASKDSGLDDVVYRGIESIWGNMRKYIDGLNVSSLTQYYVCNNQSQYADSISNYTLIGFAMDTSVGSVQIRYLYQNGYDSNQPWAMFPWKFKASFEPDKYYCDSVVIPNSGNVRVTRFGYGWDKGQQNGIFTITTDGDVSAPRAWCGHWLMYVPN